MKVRRGMGRYMVGASLFQLSNLLSKMDCRFHSSRAMPWLSGTRHSLLAPRRPRRQIPVAIALKQMPRLTTFRNNNRRHETGNINKPTDDPDRLPMISQRAKNCCCRKDDAEPTGKADTSEYPFSTRCCLGSNPAKGGQSARKYENENKRRGKVQQLLQL
jgi:hypothetical protein